MQRIFSLILYTFWLTDAYTQDIQVKNGFLTDSARTGEPILFFLSARYPESYTIVFPDSSFNFGVFEFTRKIFFPTITVNGISRDSSIYELMTFEVSGPLTLALPVYWIRKSDTLFIATAADTLFLKEMVRELPPDTVPLHQLPLIAHTEQHPVQKNINYLLIVIVFVATGIFLAVLWKTFGKRIMSYLLMRKLRKAHERFSAQFNRYLSNLGQEFNAHQAETAVTLWKKYMEELTSRPFTRLTTREIHLLTADSDLHQWLRQIDASIYGYEQSVTVPLQELQRVANSIFSKKLQELSHGRSS
jgi:hypothetical protein